MDSFLQKLKRKLTLEKESDTKPGDLKQFLSDKPDSYQLTLLCFWMDCMEMIRIRIKTFVLDYYSVLIAFIILFLKNKKYNEQDSQYQLQIY